MDWPSIYRVAALAPADPKTVKRFIDGKPTRPSVRVRIMEALLECGLVPPLPASSSVTPEPVTEPQKP